MSEAIHYREVKKYKYQLMETCGFQVDVHPDKDIFEPSKPYRAFIYLSTSGKLTIFSGYAWDGKNVAAIAPKNCMRASLVHDALYQLMRRHAISEDYRLYADKLLKKMCREDGVSMFQSSILYFSVRWFGETAIMPNGNEKVKIVTAP